LLEKPLRSRAATPPRTTNELLLEPFVFIDKKDLATLTQNTRPDSKAIAKPKVHFCELTLNHNYHKAYRTEVQAR
jgi:hypothetical protein